jgi:hypothetical protein
MKSYGAVKLNGNDTASGIQTRIQHGEIIGFLKEKGAEKMGQGDIFFSTMHNAVVMS